MEAWFALPALALVAGALALIPLGHQVLARGVVFIDLAVAQAAAAGSLWSMVLLHRGHEGPADAAGLAGALTCAAAVAWVSHRWPARREALIGLLYVLFACLALLGARLDTHGRDRMLELLAADVLWAQAPQVAALVLAALCLWLLLLWRPRFLGLHLPFYAAFAIVVSLAVPVLGLFVVFALLIAPALWWRSTEAASDASEGFRISRAWPAVALGILASLLGLAGSWWWDAPSGPCVALACAGLGLAAMVRRHRT